MVMAVGFKLGYFDTPFFVLLALKLNKQLRDLAMVKFGGFASGKA